MAVTFETQLVDVYKNNRMSAEYFRIEYRFIPKDEKIWYKIGNCLKKCQYGLSVSMNENNKGEPIYRLNEIEDLFLSNKPSKCAQISKRDKEEYRVNKKDVLFCRTNGNINYVGRTGIFLGESDSVFASYLVKSTTKENILLPEYLTVYLNTAFGRKQIVRRAMPSNQVNVSAAELKQILIPIYPISIQNEISNIVNDAFILRQLSQSLYNQAQQLLERELGLDKLVFDKPLSYEARLSEVVGNNRADADYYQTRYKQLRSNISGNRTGIQRLIDFATVLKPNINPSKSPSSEFKYVELADINPTLGIINNANTFLGKELPTRARREVTKGDVIASSVVGSVDKAALVDETNDGCLASTGFFHFRPKNNIKSEFLLLLVRSRCVTMQLQQESTGGILSAVPDQRLRNVIIPNIDPSIQNKIADLVYQSHKNINQSKQLLEQAKRRVEELIEQAVQK